MISTKLKTGKTSNVNSKAMKDAFDFMRGIMDECTHLGNFSAPIDSELAIIVNATRDGYVPTDGLLALTDIWKGSQTRYLDCGHIAAILFKLDVFRYHFNCYIQSKVFNSSFYFTEKQ